MAFVDNKYPSPLPHPRQPEEVQLDLPLEPEVLDDGSVLIGPEEDVPIDLTLVGFSENLAEYVDEEDLAEISRDLIDQVEKDLESRKDYHESLADGIEQLGFKYDEETDEPFPGACTARHPLLAESVVNFQAKSITELLPPGGPVKTKIEGMKTPELEMQAIRVKNYMNYQITEMMPEFSNEMERMLFYCGLTGSAFKKLYPDPLLGRPVSRFVSSEDFVINFDASDLRTCDRYTHILRPTELELEKYQQAGFYRDIELPEPGQEPSEPVKERIEEIEGKRRVSSDDYPHMLYEVHTYLDLSGEGETQKLPYIVTIHEESGEILSIRRNWKEGDPSFTKRVWFVHYCYVPGLGFYAYGLLHLIGGLAKCSSAALQALIDAGQFANLPAGLKAKGVRWIGSNEPLSPGEWRDVEALGADIDKAFKALPYKEPSRELFELLKYSVEMGKHFADSTDAVVADSANYGPVGTTVALLEASGKSFSAVFRRLHAAFREELKILAEINAEFMPDAGYPYNAGVPPEIARTDFDARVDVIPVSDPNISSSTQRYAQAQALHGIAVQAPDQHNMREVHLEVYKALGIEAPERFMSPPPPEPKPTDPMTENMNMLNGIPVKAFEFEHHQAHIKVHYNFLEDPNYGGNPEVAAKIGPQMIAHIADHMALDYKVHLEQQLGGKVPPAGQDPQLDAQIAQAIAQASEQLTMEHVEKTLSLTQDPVIQLQKRELDIKQQDTDRKERELALDERKTDAEIKLKAAEIKRKADADKVTEDKGLMDAAIKAAESDQNAEIEEKRIAQQAEAEEKKLAAAKAKTPKKE